MYTNPRRGDAFAAVFCNSVCAGTMESSSGSAIVTPTPRRNVRRGRCFFVMNIARHILQKKVCGQCITIEYWSEAFTGTYAMDEANLSGIPRNVLAGAGF